MTQPGLLAIDQGTTSSRAMVFDRRGGVLALAQQEYPQSYPRSGWVEQDPEALWQSVVSVARQALAEAEAGGARVLGLGISNQRETTLLWDRHSGRPVHNAIVWQDRRTAEHCRELAAAGAGELVRERSGLLLDPYFSATKPAWLLDEVPGARARAQRGELLFGTVDSFLLWRLTGGRVHGTDATNASRTSLFNIHRQQWDEDLLKLFRIPSDILPQVFDTTHDYGHTDPEILGRSLPILALVGDQQAAAFGQCCFQPGSLKSTYGTGCFALMNTGARPVSSSHRLLTTVASRIKGRVSYALEGSIFMAGATVKWLRDRLGVIDSAAETEALARSLEDNGGVYLVPAFAGLGAPWWDPEARGALLGLTQDSGPAHLARAALESVAYQTMDLLDAMAEDGMSAKTLRVDGGMVANPWLLQFLADMVDCPVERPRISETTALGAAWLAGLQCGLYSEPAELEALWHCDARFEPAVRAPLRQQRRRQWHEAVQRVLSAQPSSG